MTLNKRALGGSGLKITTVGLGTWAIGGGGWLFGWGSQEDEASIAAIRRGVKLGINWIDTAAVYGLGHSEEVVRRALADIPKSQRPMVFTKCGVVADPTHPFEPGKRNLQPESIRKECESSLRRLGVERIDLYQFHWPDQQGTPLEESWGEMKKLVEEGKVRAAGVSNFDVPLLRRCEAVMHVDSLQPPFSMIRREAAEELIPWCAANGTGVIVYSPMQAGLLTSTFTKERVAKFPKDDWRRNAAYFQEPDLSRNLQLRDALRPVANRHGVTVEAIALAWVNMWPGVTGAIAGARSADQVDGWIRAASLQLTHPDLNEISRAIAETQAGSGPAMPKGRQALAGRD